MTTKLDRAYKTVGADTIKELEVMQPDELKKRIVAANEAIREVSAELEANQQYQELKANKTALEAGKKEVNKRQNAIILIGLHFLKDLSQ